MGIDLVKTWHVMIASRLSRAFAILFAITTVVAVGAAIYFKASPRASDVFRRLALADRSAERGYRTATIERGPITTSIAAAGTLQAVATVQVGTQVSGQISEILADFNTEVKKGDVIARIDPLSFQNAVDQAEAEVGINEAALMKAQVTQREAADDEQRRRKLVAAGAGSAVELSKTVALRDLAVAEVQNATAALDKSKAALKQARQLSTRSGHFLFSFTQLSVA